MTDARVSREPPGEPLAAGTLIELIRLASPALPVGGFSYSEVLEAAVESGRVTDLASARDWLLDQLHLSLARCDLPLFAAAHEAWQARAFERVRALNVWAIITRETRELQQQSQQMGRSLLEWLRQRTSDDEAITLAAALTPAPTWPVVFALAARCSGAPLRDTMVAFAFGWAENMAQAAIKAVPLGQSAGQRLLDALALAIPEAIDTALRLGEAERQAFAPMLAILSSQHEAQYSRLFRS